MATFFQNQIQAKRNTTLLVGLYLLCVALIICGVYFVLMGVWQAGIDWNDVNRTFAVQPAMWNPDLFLKISLMTLGVVALGSIYKTIQLSRGGSAVATMLGGRLIPPNSNVPLEKKVLNIVEEMAIASGLPVPPVYLLENEEGINAFAAGHTVKNAVVAVTKGCATRLSRDELQGVIAHEFSHILNGDMRLNIRLMALLNGILIIAMIGYTMFRIGVQSSSRPRRSRDEKNPGAVILITGLSLYVLGYIGVLFANLIKAAVSRQREFLADASAVQFTRNPCGIGGALAKIGGLTIGSSVKHPSAQEAAHLFFADSITQRFMSLFATHPPIKERIKQIDPQLARQLQSAHEVESYDEATATAEPISAFASQPQDMEPSAAPHASMQNLSATVGVFQEQHLKFARSVLQTLPDAIKQSLHDPFGARALVAALLLDKDSNIRREQLAILGEKADSLFVRDLNRLSDQARNLKPVYLLPIVSAALPALRQLPPAAYREFRDLTQKLIEADKRCSIFEYSLQHMLKRNLDSNFFDNLSRTRRAVGKLEKNEAAFQLVSALASLTHADAESRERAITAGLAELEGGPERKPAAQASTLKALDDALYALEDVDPAFRCKALNACVAAVCEDKAISVEEAELVRAVADGLECPVPPFTPA